MRRAIVLSLAIHLVVALLIPPMAYSSSQEAVETITFVKIPHIVIEHRPTPRPYRPRTAAARAGIVPELSAPRPHPTPRPQRGIEASPVPLPVAVTKTAAPAIAATPLQGEAAGSPAPSPEASATPAPTNVGVVHGRAAGYLPFGAEVPDPVLDPDVRKRLEALGVHVTLVVLVGEDGRTKTVQFDRPIDPQLQAKIQALLADANWDPAVCGGGIACEGSATIKL